MTSSSIIVSGTSHKAFAESVAKHLGVKLADCEVKKFASNEIYVRMHETVRGKKVFVIQTATQNVNEDFIELFLLCDMLKRSFAERVHVVMPYFGYSRQDRVALPRETISAKLMADLLVTSGADHMITVNLHSPQIQGFFDIPVDNIDPTRLFVDYLKKLKDFKDCTIVSVDVGGAKSVKKFADSVGLPIAILHKQRRAHNQSEVTHVVGDVKGKHCIIYDDLVDTAGSVCNAKVALEKAGAKKEMMLAVTHPVLSGDAVKKLDAAKFSQILVTDSVPLPKVSPKNTTVLSLTPLMAEIVRKIEAGESVSGLY